MSYWDSCCRQGYVPRDAGPCDGHLPRLLEELSIRPCRAADIGCGTGKSLWYSLRAARTERPRFDGVPRWSSGELIDIAAPYFDVLRMDESVFTHGEGGSIPAWLCIYKNRSDT